MQKLGQHFLTNKIKLQKIAEVLDLKPGDAVIEIGPGHGELTDEIRIENNKLKIIAIEKDEEFVQFLQGKFTQDKNIEIIQGDALKILPDLCSRFHDSSFKVVGNIPFYITGFLLRILGELESKPELIVFTIQKEVAERICAQPLRRRQGFGGQAQMNLLAASVQFWAEPEIIDYIPKTDFQPQPKVDSAIIKLLPLICADKTRINAEKYYKFIKIIFKQPRKTIINNLRETNQPKEEIIKILETLKINPADRPQNLTIERIKKLAEQFMA